MFWELLLDIVEPLQQKKLCHGEGPGLSFEPSPLNRALPLPDIAPTKDVQNYIKPRKNVVRTVLRSSGFRFPGKCDAHNTPLGNG